MKNRPVSLSISAGPHTHPAMDFAFLRKEGIKHIERMAGHLWTDYNAHDPGITILEQLCFAITDLSYRIDYDMKDILAEEGKQAYQSLYSPATILTTNPVTLIDIRKQMIDVYGVKNSWIEIVPSPHPPVFYNPFDKSHNLTDNQQTEALPVKGAYRVLIEPTHTDGVDGSTILLGIKEKLSSKRNLCEEIVEINILNFQDINVLAELEVGAVDDAEQLLAEVYLRIARHISPKVDFYTLKELLEKGKPIDEIVEGPALMNGFIDSDELATFQRKTALRSSDIIQAIMDVEGIVAVKNIRLKAKTGTATSDWVLELDPSHTPRLAFRTTGMESEISLFRNGVRIKTDQNKVKQIYDALNGSDQPPQIGPAERDNIPELHPSRKISRYTSVQNQFPDNYGIGELGLPQDADTSRKSRAKQLQAYLMFFDQILANYFAQLANSARLFSFFNKENRSYFSQVLAEVPGAGELIKALDNGHGEKLQQLTEDPQNAISRLDRMLNHLMARFAEQMTDYSLILYHAGPEKQLEDKRKFLQQYPEISSQRGKGVNIEKMSWDGSEVSGFKKRICALLGIKEVGMKAIAAKDEEGLHIVEHILLRPLSAINPSIRYNKKDPWSLQLTVILPDWPVRFQDQELKNLIIQTLRQECPAHISVNIRWLNKTEMTTFETQLIAWIQSKKGQDLNAIDAAAEALMISLGHASLLTA